MRTLWHVWLLCGLLLLVGCGREALPRIDSAAQLRGHYVSTQTGSVFDQLLAQYVPGAKPYYDTNMPNAVQSLKMGKCDAILCDEPVARELIRTSGGIRILSKVAPDRYAYVFSKENAALCEEFSGAIRALKADGTLAAIEARWFGADESAKQPPAELPTGEGRGVLVAADDPAFRPFSLMKEGRHAGYDVDVIAECCRRLGYGLRFDAMEFASVLPAVVTDKAQLGFSGISVTEERRRSVLFSEPVYEGGTVLLVRDAAAEPARPGLLAGLAASFRSTFVEEQRWQMILRGLGVTLLIALCSVLSGTLLAMLVCALRRSRLRALSLPAQLYIALMRGTPIVVVLMILYYIVFQGLSVDPVPIAILGFALNFAAYSAETFRSGVAAIDPGQVEAAQAMGFSRLQIFFCITLPQATRHALPVYKGDVISTLKSTSVVGYIAIQDLTKMSDLIRSRTYEAFFPLLTTALIYLALANLMAALIGLIERRIDPQRRRVSLDFLRETDSRS